MVFEYRGQRLPSLAMLDRIAARIEIRFDVAAPEQ